MKIYVAAASAELNRATDLMDKLAAAGHEITYRWDDEVRRAGGANAFQSPSHVREVALADAAAVRAADVVLFLVPEHGVRSIGMWVELGLALSARHYRPAQSPTMIVVGDVARGYPFAILVDAVVVDDQAALDYVRRAAQASS